MVPGELPVEGDRVLRAARDGEVFQSRRSAGAGVDAVGAQAEQGALLGVGGVVGVGHGHLEHRTGRGRTTVQGRAVERGAPAPYGDGHLVEHGGVRPRGVHLSVLSEGYQGAEAGFAVDELAGAVDRVDDPHGCVASERVVDRRVGVDGLLADDDRAGQQPGQGSGEVLLRQPVGGGDQVVRAALLDDLVCGQLTVARHDLGGGRCPDRRFHLGHRPGVPGGPVQEVIDHDSS